MSDIEFETSDRALIERVRGGDLDAFSALHDRHRGSATALARRMSRNAADADDVVSEGFARVLTALQAGRGPDVAFRPYLLSTIRRLAYDRTRHEQREMPVVADEDTIPATESGDPIVDGFEREAAAAAFSSLPERWRLVLWHTEVEGESPAEVARTLGMSANAVSALAYRAREGLRQAYLNEHAPAVDSSKDCSWVRHRLGGYVRGSLTAARTTRVESHLENCSDCHAAYLELALLNSSLPALVGVAVLGGVAPAYLAEKGIAWAPAGSAAAPGSGAPALGATGSGAVGSGTGAGVGVSSAFGTPIVVAAVITVLVAAAVALGIVRSGGGGPESRTIPDRRHAEGPPSVHPGQPADQSTDDGVLTPAEPGRSSTPPSDVPTSDAPALVQPGSAPPRPFAGSPDDGGAPRPVDSRPPTAPPTTTLPAPTTTSTVTTTSTTPTTSTTVPPDPTPVIHRVSVSSAGDLVRGRPGTVILELTSERADTGASASTVAAGEFAASLALDGLRVRGDGPFPFGPPGSGAAGRTCAPRDSQYLVCSGPALDPGRAEVLFLPVMVDASGGIAVTQNVVSEYTAVSTEATGFAARHATLGRATATGAGNAVVGCPPDRPRCISNNEAPMVRIDVDGDPTTSTSSTATIDLPSGDTVLSATLWWGADLSAGSRGSPALDPSRQDRVLLRDPRGTAHMVRAERVDEIASRYHAVADVTSIVAGGGGGRWTAADIQTGTGVDRYGGWFLQVVHGSETTPVRSIVVLDGFSLVDRSGSAKHRIGGFLVPTDRSVAATLDVFTYEGDVDLTGDQLRVGGVDVVDALNPLGNTFNSTASHLGRPATGMIPDAASIIGIDLDRFDVSSALEPGSRSTVIEFVTSGDAYLPGALVFSIDQ